MAKAIKTIKQPLSYEPAHASYFTATKVLFNQVAAFYFEVIQAHPGVLDLGSKDAMTALERLTRATKEHPSPVMPLSTTVTSNIPALFRRAAINAALGSAHAFYTHLAKWRKCKEKATARGKKYTVRPPVPPRTWNKSPVLYAGQWKDRTSGSIMLKLWTGSSWAWLKVHLNKHTISEEWEMGSPTLIQHDHQWWLHTSIEKKFPNPSKVEEQVTNNPEANICAVDLNLNEHIAVCTIQTVEGTVLATALLGGAKRYTALGSDC